MNKLENGTKSIAFGMKTNIVLHTVMCVLISIFMLTALGACSQNNDESAARSGNAGNTPNGVTPNVNTYVLRDCVGDCPELELPLLWAEISGVNRFKQAYNPQQNNSETQGQIRVFENGNANVRLFPDGTFIANLFHNTKITGTYTEMTEGRETAVLFAYNGINNITGGIPSFDATGLVTAVGGIANDILTMPEDWDDGHNHGRDFAFRAYPLVFIGDGSQSIVLNADSTFEARFKNDVRIIGYYGIRTTAVAFVPGSPTFDRNGVPTGTFLLADLRVCGDETEAASN